MHRGRRLGLPRQARQHGTAALAAAGLADPVRTSDNASFAEGQRSHQDQAMLSAVDSSRKTGSPAGGDVMSSSSVASILIVDDDRGNLMALEALLQGLGQNLVLAHSGEEALRCVLKQDFAVILLEVRMPGVDGFETARLIRERQRSRDTPVIFVTGASEDVGSMFRGYEVGAVDYIFKPLIPEVLRSKVAVFIELHAKNAALVREITEHERTGERLRESEENLRALAVRLRSVREDEQIRIAREIHDELGQALTGLKMDLTWLMGKLLA